MEQNINFSLIDRNKRRDNKNEGYRKCVFCKKCFPCRSDSPWCDYKCQEKYAESGLTYVPGREVNV